ncbi:MAG: TonB-dependent receptor [Alphaproteobacteria bacterium]|nr:TonB-dependent receptor [Alphaproteobacteria bacterium]
MIKSLGFWTSAMACLTAGAGVASAQQTVPAPGSVIVQTGDAQIADGDQDTIIVTARKTAEVLRDVPLAASVIDVESIADRGGVVDAEQLLANIPSVRYAGTSTGLSSEITIRNSGPARGGGSDGAVGLYSNGAYIAGGSNNLGSRNFADIDFFDIGRVEVLRGTQGALYGRNAVGGAVNIISQRPTRDLSASVDLKYGLDNEKTELQMIANVPITDQISTRFGLKSIDQSKGFFYNTFLDRYNDDTDLFSYRAQINYRGERLEVNFLGENQIADIPQLAFTVVSPPNPAGGLPFGNVAPPRTLAWNYAGSGEQDVTMFNLTADYDMDWASITSTTMWRKRLSHQGFDVDATNPQQRAEQIASGIVCARAVPGVCSAAPAAVRDPNRTQDNFDTAETWFSDLHIAGADTGRLSWLAGLEYLQIENGSLLLSFQTNPSLTGALSVSGDRTDSKALLNSFAYYGSVGYDVTDELNVVFEARQVEDRRKRRQVQYNRFTLAPSGVRTFRDAAIQPENFSYNATVGYKLAGNFLFYAKAGTAFRAGGFNTNSGDPRQPVAIPAGFTDEQTLTYEIGAKGDITDNIFVTAAAYQSTVDDIIIQRDNGCFVANPVCPTGNTLFFTNLGQAEPRGVELELASNWDLLGGRLRANLSGAWLNGEITSGPLAGSKIPQSPEWTTGAALNYRRTVANGVDAFANLVYSYQTGGVQEVEQTPPLRQFTLVDIRVGVQFGNWEVSANATNAFDEDYVLFEGPTTRRYNVPRNVTLQLRLAS